MPLLGKLDDDLRVKLQFVSTGVHKHYDAIQVSILNRTDGLVDRETMLFGDIIGVKNTNISGRVKGENIVGTVGTVVMVIDLIILIAPIFPTEKALKNTFDKDGNRKAE